MKRFIVGMALGVLIGALLLVELRAIERHLNCGLGTRFSKPRECTSLADIESKLDDIEESQSTSLAAIESELSDINEKLHARERERRETK